LTTNRTEAGKTSRTDGLSARRLACEVIEDVIKRRLPLDERLERLTQNSTFQGLGPSDRGLVRAIATAALRRYGTIRQALTDRLAKGFPPRSGKLESILIAATAQILVLETAPHAAVDTAVTLAREDGHAKHFTDLANAVLRRISAERPDILATSDALKTDAPAWLAQRWTRAYGETTAREIASSHRQEPSLDISVKGGAEAWADRLGGVLLPTGSIRLTVRTAIPQLPGFAEGEWWVQDAAAAIPARLLDAKPGEHVLDMCAAPGGKTAQLAATGAYVTALDRSAPRMQRLQENMDRLGLTVETVVADAVSFTPEKRFDAILLDTPCSATGTIRRHPDVAWSKTMEDLFKLADLQRRLLDHAATLLKPGGRLVYATCSLEREEGDAQIASFLARNMAFQRVAVLPSDVGGAAELINDDGDMRCLPSHWPNPVDRLAGLDGFFASRLVLAGQ
jgi:16S rRNA (cytosine967-C5)-methyltransferase